MNLPPLPPHDAHNLSAAIGWLELGNYLEADKELDEITPQLRAHPTVLTVRYHVYAKAEKWAMAVEIAESLTRLLPDSADSWIWYAYATRRKTGGSIAAAKDILIEIEPRFPKAYLIPYNLACYFSRLRQFEEAQTWFKKAMALNEQVVKKQALDDPDLQPLWDSMSGTLWKRME